MVDSQIQQKIQQYQSWVIEQENERQRKYQKLTSDISQLAEKSLYKKHRIEINKDILVLHTNFSGTERNVTEYIRINCITPRNINRLEISNFIYTGEILQIWNDNKKVHFKTNNTSLYFINRDWRFANEEEIKLFEDEMGNNNND